MFEVYRRLLLYARPYRLHLILGVVAAGGVALATWADAECIGYLLDDVLKQQRREALLFLPIAIGVIHLFKGLCRYVQAILVTYAGARAVQDLRDAVYAQVVRMPVEFFSVRTTGDLQSRIISDAQLVQNGFALVIKNLIQNAITVVFLATMIIITSPLFGMVALIGLPLAIWPVGRLGRRLRRVSGEGQRGLGYLSEHLQETISGVRIVKALAMEERESERFRQRSSAHLRLTMRGVRLGELSAPMMETLSAVTFAILIYVGGGQVINGEISAEDFGKILGALGFLYVPVKAVVRAYHDISRAVGAADRLFELLDIPHEGARDLGTLEALPLEEGLELKDLSFSYAETDLPALSSVSFAVKPGEVLALVGKSGSGKSTIAQLLLRFYDPTAGQILWNGIDLKEFRLASLRRQIGWVSQDIVLFDGSVRENIAYGQPSVSEEEIVAAARAAHALEFIERLPLGFDTQIGERGVRLSGGQKQRLSIARTLIANPPLLVLDEATSALDAESEGIVQAAIEGLMRGRTTILIAHRLSTIQNANRVLVLDRGRLVEEGTIPELLAKNGIYTQLASGDLFASVKPPTESS